MEENEEKEFIWVEQPENKSQPEDKLIVKQKTKGVNLWTILALLFLLVSTMAYIAVSYRTYGARLACDNSGMYLDDDFKCVEYVENQNEEFEGYKLPNT